MRYFRSFSFAYWIELVSMRTTYHREPMYLPQKAVVTEKKNFSRIVSDWTRQTDKEENILSGYFDDDKTVWLAQHSKLLVADTESGEQISQFRFARDSVIDCGTAFQLPGNSQGLLLGVCNESKYLVCCYDAVSNRLLSAVIVPHRVVSLSVVVNGDNSSTNGSSKIHAELKKWSAVVALGTVEGHVYLHDVALRGRTVFADEMCPNRKLVCSIEDDFGDSTGLVDITEFLRSTCTSLDWPDGEKTMSLATASTAVTALYYIQEACILAIGFNSGGILLYSLENLEPLHLSPYEPNAAAVMQFAVVEPEDDPRPTLYLWALRDSKACLIEGIDRGMDAPSLEMYQLNFFNRSKSGDLENVYSDFSICVSRLYWFPDACSTLLSCTTLSMWSESGKTVADAPPLTSRIFLYFFWVAKNGKTMGCLFDVNSWYHAQMPSNVLPSAEYAVCPFLTWHYYHAGENGVESLPLVCIPRQRSVRRYRQLPDSQFNYFACSYSLNVDLITRRSIEHSFVPDIQNLVLDTIVQRGIDGLDEPNQLFSYLQFARLLSSTDIDCNAEQMRHEIWTVMLENGRLSYLTESFHSSMSANNSLREEFVQWAWSQAVSSKERLDSISGSLFNGPTVGISEGLERTLRKEACNLALLLDAHSFCRQRLGLDLSDTAHAKLGIRELALQETCLFANMILWFLDAGVLPEKEGFYRRRAIQEMHRNLSATAARDGRKLLIDELCEELNEALLERPVDGLDCPIVYPPPTFQDVLSVYLISQVDVMVKHTFVFYTLMDLKHVSALSQEILEKFENQVLDILDPSLANYSSLIWHIDQNDSQATSRYLLSSLISSPKNDILRDRLSRIVTLKHVSSLVCNASFASVLPSVSFFQDQQMPQFKRRTLQRCVEASEILARPSHISSRGRSETGTPLKRRVHESSVCTVEHSSMNLSKRSRLTLDAPPPESDESLDQIDFEEARSLLKVPRSSYSTAWDTSIDYTPPVSILRSTGIQKREKSKSRILLMDRSIRFAVPPQSEEQDSPVNMGNGNFENGTKSGSSVRTYQSPTDEEVQFVFSRHRWSLADAPSPTEEQSGDGQSDDVFQN